jgi:ribosomal protein S18 acetylase RimI-like enzyme
MSTISIVNELEADSVESIGQFASMWKVLVGERCEAGVKDLPGLAVRWADCAFPFWNGIFVTDTEIDAALLASRLGEAASCMRRKRQLGFLWLCEDHLDDGAKASLPAALAKEGLDFALTTHGMAGDILPLKAPRHPALSFRRVTTEDELRDYADINSRAYGFGLEMGRAGLEGSALWKGEVHSCPVHAYLGYAGDVAVSAAATVVNDGALFLVLVATLPEAQRKGYGEAVVRKALYEGAKGTRLRRTILHGTDAGYPVYRRIGYRKVATINAYKLAR